VRGSEGVVRDDVRTLGCAPLMWIVPTRKVGLNSHIGISPKAMSSQLSRPPL
jgi:hypothetical protein